MVDVHAVYHAVSCVELLRLPVVDHLVLGYPDSDGRTSAARCQHFTHARSGGLGHGRGMGAVLDGVVHCSNQHWRCVGHCYVGEWAIAEFVGVRAMNGLSPHYSYSEWIGNLFCITTALYCLSDMGSIQFRIWIGFFLKWN